MNSTNWSYEQYKLKLMICTSVGHQVVVFSLFSTFMSSSWMRSSGCVGKQTEDESSCCLQQVSSSRPVFSTDESSYSRAFSHQYESSSHGRHGVYTRRHSQLPPPSSLSSSSSSSNIIIDPAKRSRQHSYLCPVQEKPEGPIETLRAAESTGVSTSDDSTAETLQRDNKMKINQSEDLEDPYR